MQDLWFLCWLSIVLVVKNGANGLGNTPENGVRGGKLLTGAVDRVLGSNRQAGGASSRYVSTEGVLPATRIRSRCVEYLACDQSTPTIDISNAIFHKGVLYLHNLDRESHQVISQFSNYYSAIPDHLPSSLRRSETDLADWAPGPEYKVIDSSSTKLADIGGHATCKRVWDTSAYFLHPWEHTNAFHSLNDNVFSVLANILIQRFIFDRDGRTLGTDFKTLFIIENGLVVFSKQVYL